MYHIWNLNATALQLHLPTFSRLMTYVYYCNGIITAGENTAYGNTINKPKTYVSVGDVLVEVLTRKPCSRMCLSKKISK